MMLSLVSLKQFIESQKQVSLADLESYFHEDQDSIRDLMYHLINKGCVVEKRLTANCGSLCQQCVVSKTIIYHWQS